METTVTLLCLNCLNVIGQIVGLSCLFFSYQTSSQKHLSLYLINLTLTHLLFNFLSLFKRATTLFVIPTSTKMTLIMTPTPSQGTDSLGQMTEYIFVVTHAGLYVIIQFNMLYIAVDRLAKMLFNFRYVLHWSETKAKLLLMITWCVITCFCVVIATINTCHYFDWKVFCFSYIYPSVQVSFTLITCLAFLCVFVEHRRNRRHKMQLSLIEVSIMKRLFLVPCLLMLSFVVLVALPDTIYHFAARAKRGNKNAEDVEHSEVLYTLQGFLTVIVYTTMSPDMRKMFSRLLNRAKHRNRRSIGDNNNEYCRREPNVAFVLPNLYREELSEETKVKEENPVVAKQPRMKTILMVSQV